MSSREYAQWVAYSRIEPLGDRRGDLQAAVVASTVANVNRDPKKRREPFKPEEFMPNFEEKREEKSPREIYGIMRAWAVLARGEEL